MTNPFSYFTIRRHWANICQFSLRWQLPVIVSLHRRWRVRILFWRVRLNLPWFVFAGIRRDEAGRQESRGQLIRRRIEGVVGFILIVLAIAKLVVYLGCSSKFRRGARRKRCISKWVRMLPGTSWQRKARTNSLRSLGWRDQDRHLLVRNCKVTEWRGSTDHFEWYSKICGSISLFNSINLTTSQKNATPLRDFISDIGNIKPLISL